MKPIKAACVQAAPVFLDLEASIDKAGELCAEAASNGAKLIAFPETWLPGYPWWIWTNTPINAFPFLPRYHENSMVVGSPQMRRLQEIAYKNGIAMVMGYSERDHGTRYMSQVFIDEEGTILLNRRKLKPTHMERVVFGEGDGSDLTAVDMDFGRVGGLNCWEHVQPLIRMSMHAQNEYVHVASWPSLCMYRDLVYALGPEVTLAASQLYALEGSCFVLASTAIISQEMFDIVAGDDPEKARLLNPRTSKPGGGFAMIFGPDGRPLCEALPEDQEGILYADLDPVGITLAKGAADPVGHYGRGDALRLLINREKRTVVQEIGADQSFEPIRFDDIDAN